MTQDEWNVMSNADKHQLLTQSNFDVKVQAGMDGNAKVGDPDAIKTYYTVFAGDVQVSESNTDLKESVDQAYDFINSLVE